MQCQNLQNFVGNEGTGEFINSMFHTVAEDALRCGIDKASGVALDRGSVLKVYPRSRTRRGYGRVLMMVQSEPLGICPPSIPLFQFSRGRPGVQSQLTPRSSRAQLARPAQSQLRPRRSRLERPRLGPSWTALLLP